MRPRPAYRLACLALLCAALGCAADDRAAPPAQAAPPAALDRLLVELKAVAPPENWTAFEDAQRRWDDYARADCEWKRTLTDGGSAGARLYALCLDAKSRQRVNELKLLLCEGYGLTGPCDASRRYDVTAK